ncbi:MAG: TlpA family protein disulfide reductase [Gammaproteobacteria bacterium]|nr:MAG: TlpA family protein disulfide reductase [Gammaproteobacteria bacterium]
MMTRALVRHLVLSAILIIPLPACSPKTEPASSLHPGLPFPELKLQRLDGSFRNFRAASGKVTLFNAWGTWCPPCRKELPSLDHLNTILDKDHFDFILMAMDTDPLVVREYLHDNHIRLTTYIDQDLHITNDILELKVYPTTFIIDQKGIIQLIVSGEKDWDSDAVIETMNELWRNGMSTTTGMYNNL